MQTSINDGRRLVSFGEFGSVDDVGLASAPFIVSVTIDLNADDRFVLRIFSTIITFNLVLGSFSMYLYSIMDEIIDGVAIFDRDDLLLTQMAEGQGACHSWRHYALLCTRYNVTCIPTNPTRSSYHASTLT
jgi:hypothetical protein